MSTRSPARLVGERMPGLDLRSTSDHALIVVGFDRTVAVCVDTVWSIMSSQSGLSRWLGPAAIAADGSLSVTLTAERQTPAVRADVVHLSEGSHVTVAISQPRQARRHVTISLDSDRHLRTPNTTITAIQSFTDAAQLERRGPLWDFYLDRLAAVVEGRDPRTIRLEPDYLPGLVPHFRGLIRQAIRHGQKPGYYD